MEQEKRSVSGVMVVRTYEVLSRAVEEGYRLGWNRAHKHTDNPGEDHIEDQVISAIMGQICEVFDFPESDLVSANAS